MEACKVCKTEFEPWEAEFDCNNCDEFGQEERWYDWSFGEPDIITCQDCGGKGLTTIMEHSFCCEDCRNEYFNPNTI